ncbi:MAG: HAD family hydrolase [Candidatus Caldarchaeum sp.]|nr:HAD family hydrolase [Candidatus Caldarchaeum sp.]MDW8063763.1 HAD family hydrolase [Candidatus Caldarchaeum sp.]
MPTGDGEVIKAVFLDVDGTLYRSREYEEHLLSQAVSVIAELLGIGKHEAFRKLAETKKIYKTVSKSVEVLGISRKVFYDKLADKVKPSEYIRRSDEVPQILRALRGRGIFVGLHTNSGRKLAKKVLDCLMVSDDCYDFIVTSDEAEPKPSDEGYRLLLAKAGVRASEALYVGDRCDVEVAPAKKLGLKTAIIHGGGCEFADIILTDIRELLSFV